jgi:hypothetical protein
MCYAAGAESASCRPVHSCKGVNAADQNSLIEDNNGKPEKWLRGTGEDVQDGLLQTLTWSIVIANQKTTLHHPECPGTCSIDVDCCQLCRSIWEDCSPPAASGSISTQGRVRTPFYGHVLKVLHAGKRGQSWAGKYATKPLKVSERTVVQKARRVLQKRARDRAAESKLDPQLKKVLSLVSKKWGLLGQGERESMQEQAHNIGREGALTRGRRWRGFLGKHHGMKELLHGGPKRLREWTGNGYVLPTKNTVYKDVPRVGEWGLQEPQLDMCKEAFGKHHVDIDLSFDEVKVNEKLDAVKDKATGCFVVQGAADACVTMRYGPAKRHTFTDKESIPTDIPVASYVSVWLTHAHENGQPKQAVHMVPTDGGLVEGDYILHFHGVEVALHNRGIGVGNLGADSAAPQLSFLWGFARPFCNDEDVQVCELAATAKADDERWLHLAVSLRRPVGIVLQRGVLLREADWGSGKPHVAQGMCMPFRQWPWAFNKSSFSASVQCVSSEWRHGVRLLVKHLRDKHSKLVVWSFLVTASPAMLCDVQCMYLLDDELLTFKAIDQSDYTQSNARAAELSSFVLVARLCECVPGSVGTAMHVLVQAAYLHVFMDAEYPISMGARVVLAVFALSAVVSQRLRVMMHGEYKLPLYSLTSPTFHTIVLHVNGFLAVLRKGFESFSHRPLVPSLLGEWQNEELFSMARDPSCQRTSNFSAHEFMVKANTVLHMQNKEHANPEKWKSGDRPPVHDAALYMPVMDLQELHEAMMLGWQMWQDVAMMHGYKELFQQFPTLPLQYAKLLTKTKPVLGEGVSWEAWHDYILHSPESAEVVQVEQAAAPSSVVKARYSKDLEAFYGACEAVMRCTDHVVGPEADVVDDGEVGVAPPPHVGGEHVVSVKEAKHLVAKVLNAHVRKQGKDTLGRYQAGSLRCPASFVRQGGCEEMMMVGKTYAFLFEMAGEVRLYVGRMRAAVAQASTAREGSKCTQVYLGVSMDDASASYFCHPYAQVLCSEEGIVSLEVSIYEKHQWWKLVRTAEKVVVQHDSDSEYEDDEHEPEVQVGEVSNVLGQVDGVVWDASGASVTPHAAHQLSALHGKHVPKACKVANSGRRRHVGKRKNN